MVRKFQSYVLDKINRRYLQAVQGERSSKQQDTGTGSPDPWVAWVGGTPLTVIRMVVKTKVIGREY